MAAAAVFLVGYPLLMVAVWILLALVFVARREWRERWLLAAPPAEHQPPVTVLIPCFNEGPQLLETLRAALHLDWPDWEVIAINDGSVDDTGEQLEALLPLHPRLRVVHLASNQGKALALRAGALLARHELLLCIDADAVLDPQALGWMVRHLVADPRVGAVSGNPRIRNRTTLLGRLQVGEFSMIVGLIKRAQSVLGPLFCVSGVMGLFRRRALHDVGYWNPDRLTEDIALTWALQRAGWRVRYEPHALVWILMPETLPGLWKQRLRWAQGGLEVLVTNGDLLRHPRQWRLWVLLVEPSLTLAWAWLLALSLVELPMELLLIHPQPAARVVAELLPHGLAAALLPACLLQVLISLWLDRPYDRGLGRNGFWMIWYPVAFWLVTLLASLVALPSLLHRGRGVRARWESPDRGRRS
jgi:biofilm PGA synthesis N-glycosyltransferase PgaC